jgi:hypothetical protein
MSYPLAHDENGFPLELPPGAARWLVRRHGGGKGRPAAVYDAEGTPLVVPLDATTDDLRAAGCRPGSYRLDAVGADRKPLGACAYTEVAARPDDPVEAGGPAPEAAVAALARAVEAMQRVQAERERVQSEMFMKLIDRLAPPPQPAAHDLRNAIGQFADAQRTLRELAADQNETASDYDDDDDDEAPDLADPGARVLALVEQCLPPVMAILSAKWGMKPAEPKAATKRPAPRNAQRPATPTGASKSSATAEASSRPAEAGDPKRAEPPEADADAIAALDELLAPEVADKARAVWSELSGDERQLAGSAIGQMAPETRGQVETVLRQMPIQAAVAMVRQFLAELSPAGPTDATEDAA